MEFKRVLTELVNVLEPLARALLCLESTQSTLGDVYFFWLAALAVLNQHFSSKNSRLSNSDKLRLQAMIYRRFNETINEAPTDIYVTAFFLDPRKLLVIYWTIMLTYYVGYRTAAIYSDYNKLYSAQRFQPAVQDLKPLRGQANVSSASLRLTESQYTRVRKQLLQLLRHELVAAEQIPGHPLYQYDALKAKTELIQQLSQYHLGHPPFRQFSEADESTIQYWQSHRASHLTFILAVSVIFSIHVIFIC